MDSYTARPRYAPRRPAAVQKRRRTPQSKGWLKRLFALQTLICIILLLMVVIIKGIHIAPTEFISKQVDYVLSRNVELKSIFTYVENLASDFRNSIVPDSAKKSTDDGLLATEGSRTADDANGEGNVGGSIERNVGGTGIKTGSDDTHAALNTSGIIPKTSEQDDLNAGSADTSIEFSNDSRETPASAGNDNASADGSGAGLVPENPDGASENATGANDNISDGSAENAANSSGTESGIGDALAHPETSVLAASSEEAATGLPEMTAPAYGSIDTPFGKISGGNSDTIEHNGIDIGLKPGGSVIAAADGEVAEAGISPEYGAFIRIAHKGGLQTVYAGCAGFVVQKGTKINKGDVVARIGNSAISVGYHLHFEVWKDGKPVNPLEYISVDAG